jgi:hypothetical protein
MLPTKFAEAARTALHRCQRVPGDEQPLEFAPRPSRQSERLDHQGRLATGANLHQSNEIYYKIDKTAGLPISSGRSILGIAPC